MNSTHDDPINPEAEEQQAIERLARSPDGPLIRRYFRRVLESCRASADAGALQRHEGARILARDFMVHMDRGLEAPRDGSGDQLLTRSGQPVRAGLGSRADQRRREWASDEQRREFLGFDPSYKPDAA